jgi:hypothetical protein
MQIRVSERRGRRSAWLDGHRKEGKRKYCGCVISLCLEKSEKREMYAT